MPNGLTPEQHAAKEAKEAEAKQVSTEAKKKAADGSKALQAEKEREKEATRARKAPPKEQHRAGVAERAAARGPAAGTIAPASADVKAQEPIAVAEPEVTPPKAGAAAPIPADAAIQEAQTTGGRAGTQREKEKFQRPPSIVPRFAEEERSSAPASAPPPPSSLRPAAQPPASAVPAAGVQTPPANAAAQPAAGAAIQGAPTQADPAEVQALAKIAKDLHVILWDRDRPAENFQEIIKGWQAWGRERHTIKELRDAQAGVKEWAKEKKLLFPADVVPPAQAPPAAGVPEPAGPGGAAAPTPAAPVGPTPAAAPMQPIAAQPAAAPPMEMAPPGEVQALVNRAMEVNAKWAEIEHGRGYNPEDIKKKLDEFNKGWREVGERAMTLDELKERQAIVTASEQKQTAERQADLGVGQEVGLVAAQTPAEDQSLPSRDRRPQGPLSSAHRGASRLDGAAVGPASLSAAPASAHMERPLSSARQAVPEDQSGPSRDRRSRAPLPSSHQSTSIPGGAAVRAALRAAGRRERPTEPSQLSSRPAASGEAASQSRTGRPIASRGVEDEDIIVTTGASHYILQKLQEKYQEVSGAEQLDHEGLTSWCNSDAGRKSGLSAALSKSIQEDLQTDKRTALKSTREGAKKIFVDEENGSKLIENKTPSGKIQFATEGEFTGIVEMPRVDGAGRKIPGAFDVVEFVDGKPKSVVYAANERGPIGKSQLDTIHLDQQIKGPSQETGTRVTKERETGTRVTTPSALAAGLERGGVSVVTGPPASHTPPTTPGRGDDGISVAAGSSRGQ